MNEMKIDVVGPVKEEVVKCYLLLKRLGDSNQSAAWYLFASYLPITKMIRALRVGQKNKRWIPYTFRALATRYLTTVKPS